MSTKRTDSNFHKKAGRIIRRLALVNWLGFLHKSTLIVFGAAIVLLLSLRLAGRQWFGVWAVVSLIGAWLLATALWAWVRKPTPLDAYALWDEKSHRHEAFLSAYWFESSDHHNPLEKLHIERSRKQLEDEATHLKKQVPITCAYRMFVAPILLIALTASPLLKPSVEEANRRLTDADRRRARTEAEKIAKESKRIDPLAGLEKKEKKKIEALKKSLKETAEKLKDTGEKTKREILEELDKQARKAEELAKELGTKESMDLSSGMLAELERHADTSDMAAELRKKNAAGSADETEKLAGRLKSDDLTLETQSRITKAFKKGMDAATKNDKKSLVGKHFQKVDQKLQKKLPKKAADDLSDLAKKLRRHSRRQKSQQMLRRLAQKLRQSGQNLFGQNRSGLKQLAAGGPQRLQRLNAQNMPALNRLPFGQRSPWSRPFGSLPPGMGRPGTPTPGAPMAGQAPVPGMGQCPGGMRPGGGQFPGQGSCSGGGQGMVPGGQGACQGSGQGAGSPVPGQGGGQGGLYAGVGSPGMTPSETKPMKSTETNVVGAAPSTEGPSQFRNIEATPHTEDTIEQAKALAIDFIQTEEDALSKEPIPLSRQEQVLRYFAELRNQINKTSEEPK